MNHHSVSYYADLLCITPDTLNKSVKNLFGKSAKQFINDFLIQEAEWLLTNPEKNISEIAEGLGFSSVSAFSKFFRNLMGCSPMEYRTKNV